MHFGKLCIWTNSMFLRSLYVELEVYKNVVKVNFDLRVNCRGICTMAKKMSY